MEGSVKEKQGIVKIVLKKKITTTLWYLDESQPSLLQLKHRQKYI